MTSNLGRKIILWRTKGYPLVLKSFMTSKSFFHYLCRCGTGQLSNKALGRTETSFPPSSETSEVNVLFWMTFTAISATLLILLWKRSAKDKGYFHSSGQEFTDQCCFTHVYMQVCFVSGKGSPSLPSVPFTQLFFSKGSLEFIIWQWSSFSLFFSLCPYVQILPAFSTSLSFFTWWFFSDNTTDESGFWLTLHKKCTVNSCWDLGKQRYAWPSKDDIFTMPLCMHIMPSSASRLGHLTSEMSMKIRWIEGRKRDGEYFLLTDQFFQTFDSYVLGNKALKVLCFTT